MLASGPPVDLGDFDSARASAMTGRRADATRYLELAGQKTCERDQRNLLLGDLASVPRD